MMKGTLWKKKKKRKGGKDCFWVSLGEALDQCFSVCRLRDRGCISKSGYVCVFHDCGLLRYVQFNSLLCVNV